MNRRSDSSASYFRGGTAPPTNIRPQSPIEYNVHPHTPSHAPVSLPSSNQPSALPLTLAPISRSSLSRGAASVVGSAKTNVFDRPGSSAGKSGNVHVNTLSLNMGNTAARDSMSSNSFTRPLYGNTNANNSSSSYNFANSLNIRPVSRGAALLSNNTTSFGPDQSSLSNAFTIRPVNADGPRTRPRLPSATNSNSNTHDNNTSSYTSISSNSAFGNSSLNGNSYSGFADSFPESPINAGTTNAGSPRSSPTGNSSPLSFGSPTHSSLSPSNAGVSAAGLLSGSGRRSARPPSASPTQTLAPLSPEAFATLAEEHPYFASQSVPIVSSNLTNLKSAGLPRPTSSRAGTKTLGTSAALLVRTPSATGLSSLASLSSSLNNVDSSTIRGSSSVTSLRAAASPSPTIQSRTANVSSPLTLPPQSHSPFTSQQQQERDLFEQEFEENIVQVNEPDFISEFIPPHQLKNPGPRIHTAPFTITVIDRPLHSAGPMRRTTSSSGFPARQPGALSSTSFPLSPQHGTISNDAAFQSNSASATNSSQVGASTRERAWSAKTAKDFSRPPSRQRPPPEALHLEFPKTGTLVHSQSTSSTNAGVSMPSTASSGNGGCSTLFPISEGEVMSNGPVKPRSAMRSRGNVMSNSESF